MFLDLALLKKVDGINHHLNIGSAQGHRKT